MEKSKNASESNKVDDICKVFGVHVVKSVKNDAFDGFGKMFTGQGINCGLHNESPVLKKTPSHLSIPLVLLLIHNPVSQNQSKLSL